MTTPVIICDAEIMNGMPCFRGTRVPFKNLIDYLQGGHPLDKFLRQFPAVSRKMAVGALEEAKASLAEVNWPNRIHYHDPLENKSA